MNSKKKSFPEFTDSKQSSALTATSLSSPLGLQRFLRRADVGFNGIPFLDFLAILFLFALLGSELVFTPGYTFDLPDSRNASLEGLPVTGVLTLRPNMILFDGAQRNLLNLEGAMRDYLSEQDRADPSTVPQVLLVKMDREVTMDQFLEITEIARAAGFQRVQVAGNAQNLDSAAQTLMPVDPVNLLREVE